jgi:hypothetical protein
MKPVPCSRLGMDDYISVHSAPKALVEVVAAHASATLKSCAYPAHRSYLQQITVTFLLAGSLYS